MIKKLDFPSNNRACVMIPHMGAGNMPDFDTIKSTLQSKGITVLNPDLSRKEALKELPWDQIGVIDLSNMRGCLTSFDKYLGILDRLHDFIERETEGKQTISMFPDYDDIKWIACKTKYLSFLEEHDVPIIPTEHISSVKDPENASIIAQPDNIDHLLYQIYDFIGESPTNKFVLKPSTSSLGRGLVFIDYEKNTSTFNVTIPKEDEKPHETQYRGHKSFVERFLKPYFLNTASHDHRFLFQQYVNNLETSAIFINGTPHFVERTQGENSHIAHARFGGKDTIIETPELELVEFVGRVMKALPPNIRQSMFLRVDVMKNLDTQKYILSEIEGAGATRLWLKEANRTDDFAAMLQHCAISPHLPNKNTATAPTSDGTDAHATNTIV